MSNAQEPDEDDPDAEVEVEAEEEESDEEGVCWRDLLCFMTYDVVYVFMSLTSLF